MSRDEVIARYRDLQSESADLLAVWLDEHPNESEKALCVECDPDNWNALRLRVRRARQRLNANAGAESQVRARETERKRQSHAKSVLGSADESTVEEIVSALPTQAVERIMHSATTELGHRDRQVPRSRPVGKSLFQRFADHCFHGWKLQDEMQETPPPTGDELIRFRNVAEANRAFAEASLRWLDTGDFDDEVAALLEEVQGS